MLPDACIVVVVADVFLTERAPCGRGLPAVPAHVEQRLHQRLQIQAVDPLDLLDHRLGPALHAQARPQHRSQNRRDGVGVAAQAGGQAQGFERVHVAHRHLLSQGERHHHRLLGGDGGANQFIHQVGKQGFVATADAQGARPTDTGGNTPAGNPMAVALRLLGDLGADVQGFAQVDAIDAGGHYRSHRRRAGDAQCGVVGDLARLDHRLDKLCRVAHIHGDAHGRDAHGGAIGGAVASGLLGRVPGKDQVDGTLGRRPEQILGALGAHPCFPVDQPLGEYGGCDLALALDQQLTDQDRLFSVVGDGARGHIRCDGLVGASRFQGSDGPEALLHLLTAQGLGRHTQGIAQGQTVEGAEGAGLRGHFEDPNCKCRRKCTGSSKLSTYSMKRSRRS